jgi:uncharacterized protein (DUF2147 family)
VKRGMTHVYRKIALAGALLAAAATAFAQTASPVGLWQTLDDSTGQPKALVQITQDADGTLSGKVIAGLPVDHPEERCTQCTDDRKDQLIKGMTIIRSMKQDGDNVWDGGDILDPQSGKVYSCKITVLNGGQQLSVRGYIGVTLLGRSQTWNRQQ